MTLIGLYTDSDTIGGAERSLLNLVAAYRGEAQLVILSTSPHFLREASHLQGANSTLVHARSSLMRGALDHRRQFLDLGLDLLQVTLANPFASRPALLGGVLARIPTVAVEQLVLPSRRRRGSVVKRLFARAQAGTVAVGSASADDLTRYFGIPRRSITVVHNGVAESEFIRRPAASPPVVGCAARLEDQKGVDLLLQAMAQIVDARLVLVGDGERRGALQQQARELGIADRVEFTGWLHDARRAIASFDVFALASRDEAFPLTIVEAMLCGTPVVASDVGSVAEAVIDSETGLLVPSGDVPALVDALRRLLGDSELRDRLATAAHAHALQHFTDTAMADGYDRLWRSILR